MRQAMMTQPGVIEHRDVPAPAPGPGEVLLRVKRIGVCGSDVHVWHGQHPFTPYPVVQGHEFSAVIEAVGEGVTKFRPGQRATAAPQVVCGTCRPCQRGDYLICDRLKVRGFLAPGCAQDLFLTEEYRLVPFPDKISFDEGAVIEGAHSDCCSRRKASRGSTPAAIAPCRAKSIGTTSATLSQPPIELSAEVRTTKDLQRSPGELESRRGGVNLVTVVV